MKGIFKRLRLRQGRKTVVLGAIGLAVLCMGGGAVYAKLGGQARPAASGDIELQRGLVGWWKLDGNAKDSSPYADNGTITASTLAPTPDRKGKANSAYMFDGSTAGNYIDMPYNAVYNSNLLSVSVWVNLSSASGSRNAVTRGNVNTTDGSWALGTTSGGTSFLFKIRLGGTVYQTFSPTNFSTGSWHHLVGIYDGSNASLYTDGVLVKTTAAISTVPATSDGIRLGSDTSNSGRWPGGLDNVRLYNRAISAAEAKALFDQYDPGVQAASGENGLAGWWKFDGNAKDATPNSDNGTVSGATLTADRKGRASSAYLFNGGMDVVAVPSNSKLNTSTFTYSAWVRPTSFAANSTIIGSSSDNGPQLQVRALPAGQLALNKQGVTQICNSSTNVLPLNTWSHVVVAYDGSTGCTFYINGSQYVSTGIASSLTFSSLNIGRRADNSESFVGSIDDVRVYSRLLSAPEVAAQYNSYDSQINLNSSPSNTASGGNINAGLVGYWPFNGNPKDATPYSDNGTVSGATLTADRKGRASSAYSFNGTSNYIDIPASSVLNASTFTYSLWEYISTTAASYTFIGSSGTGGPLWMLANGGFQSGDCANGVVGAGAWHHVVYTHDNSSGATHFYVDGVLNASCTTTPQTYTFSNLQFGVHQNSSQYFAGTMDDVRVYNRVLSDAEILSLYQANN